MLQVAKYFGNFISSLNPAVVVYFFAGAFVLLRWLSANRRFHNFLKLFLFVALISAMVGGFFSNYVSLIPNLFVLRSDWFVSSLFGAIEVNSVPILIALLLVAGAVAGDYSKLSSSFCLRFALHIGSAVGVLFARDSMSVLFYLELVVIVSAAITIGDRKVPRRDAIVYASLHVLSGILMLIGILAGVSGVSGAGFGSAFDLSIVSLICFSISVAISMGLPPFGFLFVDVYGAADTRNSVVLASFLSKLAICAYIPMVNGGVRVVMQFCGFLFIPYIFVRLILQKSLKKIVLLSLLAHSAGIVLFASCVNFSNDGLLRLYIAVCMLVAFFSLSVVRIIETRTGLLASDVNLLSFSALRRDKVSFALLLLLPLLLVGFPGSAAYAVESALASSVELPSVLVGLIAVQALSFVSSAKIVFAFLGWLPSGGAPVPAVSVNGVSLRKPSTGSGFFILVSLAFVVLCCGGFYLYPGFGGVGEPGVFNAFSKDSLLHYFAAFLLGVGLFLVSVNWFGLGRLGTMRVYNLAFVVTELILSFYRVFIDIFAIVTENIAVCYRFALKLFRVGARRVAVNEFSPFYSSEAVICLSVLVLAFLATLIS